MKLKQILITILISVNIDSFALEPGWIANIGNDASPGAVNEHAAKTSYQIIMDAGSSGTRIYVYKQKRNTIKDLPQFQELLNHRTATPLAKQTVSGAQKLVSDLLTLAKTELIKHKQTNTNNIRVNLLATAGMRKLAKDKQEEIYDGVRKTIKAESFTVGEVRTLDGYQEGIYTWAALNYLSDTFKANTALGSIEVGGASLQIVYPSTTLPKNTSDYKMVTLVNNQQYSVFSRTWLGLGDNDALASMNKSINRQYCYPNQYIESTMDGAFDLLKCKTLFQEVIATQLNMVDPKGITFNGVSSPAIMLNEWGIPTQAKQLNATVDKYCSESIGAVRLKIPKKAKETPLQYIANTGQICAKSSYIIKLLDILGQNTESSAYQARKTIKGTEVNWSLGYYILQESGIKNYP